jgi:hypothetical protein
MPKRIALAAYYIKVRNHTKRKYEALSDFEGHDAFEFFKSELQKMQKGNIDNQQSNQVVSASRIDENGRVLSGIIETGEYGYESNLYDTEMHKVVHNRKQKEADMWPFYFYVEVPEGTDEGFLILQRTGNMGIRSIVAQLLQASFISQYPDFRLHFLPSVESEEAKKHRKGKIQEVRFIKMRPPTDRADAFDHGHQEFPVHLELSIRATRGRALDMHEFLTEAFGREQPSGRYALDLDEDHYFEYDDVVAKTKIHGSSRTIRASDPGRFRSYYDVTDKVKFGSGGHPEYDSLHEQALKHIEIIKDQTYGKGV